MANLGITVKDLTMLCMEQVKKGNGDKHVLLSSDDEGNSYHTLFYAFMDNPEEIAMCLELEHDGTHTKDNCVILG